MQCLSTLHTLGLSTYMQGMKNALKRHQAEIVAAMPQSLTEMTLYINTLDHPVQHRRNGKAAAREKWALPIFSWCSTPSTFDVPVPDFTFQEYPKTLQVCHCLACVRNDCCVTSMPRMPSLLVRVEHPLCFDPALCHSMGSPVLPDVHL